MLQIEEATLIQLRKDIESQLAAIGAKHGVALTVSGGVVHNGVFTARMTAVNGDGELSVQNLKWKENFLRLATEIGLSPTDYGRTLKRKTAKNGRALYRLVGLSPKTNDIIVQTGSNSYYRMPLDSIEFVDDAYEPIDTAVETVDQVAA